MKSALCFKLKLTKGCSSTAASDPLAFFFLHSDTCHARLLSFGKLGSLSNSILGPSTVCGNVQILLHEP